MPEMAFVFKCGKASDVLPARVRRLGGVIHLDRENYKELTELKHSSVKLRLKLFLRTLLRRPLLTAALSSLPTDTRSKPDRWKSTEANIWTDDNTKKRPQCNYFSSAASRSSAAFKYELRLRNGVASEPKTRFTQLGDRIGGGLGKGWIGDDAKV
jgi:hypothetical protein